MIAIMIDDNVYRAPVIMAEALITDSLSRLSHNEMLFLSYFRELVENQGEGKWRIYRNPEAILINDIVPNSYYRSGGRQHSMTQLIRYELD